MNAMRICTFIVFLPVFLVSCSFTNTQIAQEFRTVELQTLEGHSGEIGSISLSPDGNYLVSGSRDDTAKLWVALRQ